MSIFVDDPCESGSSELEVWGRSRLGDRRGVFTILAFTVF